MRKFLLSMALVLCTAGAMAQGTIRFTFTRGTDNSATVTSDVDGVTANIEATSASNAWNTGGAMATRTDVLCQNTNTSASTTTPITFTLTINGLNSAHTYKSAVFTHIAVNSGGDLQPSNNIDVRHCNFELQANGASVGTKSDENIWIPAGKTEKNIIFNNDCAVSEDGTLTLTLTINKGTTNNGCFYGLKSITLFPIAIVPGQFNSVKLTPTISSGDDRKGAIMACDASAGLCCQADSDNSSDEIFTFDLNEGKLYMRSVHTQTYISSIGGNNEQVKASAESFTDAKNISIQKLGETEIEGATVALIGITPAGGQMLNCANKPGNVVAYNNTAPTKASSWYLKEETEFYHILSVTDAGWATLVLGFNATIPTAEGFKAYTIASEEDGYVTLAEATGVLKANVPVLVNAPEGTYNFAYTTDAATVTESGLEGTLYNKNITANAYVLGIPEGETEICFAKAVTDGQADGTFLNNANKAYFVPTNAQANVASYSFHFGEGTTGIDKVKGENGNVEVVYDLTGRRVEDITAPGIYIVNGVKRVIR
ncbi:MAG: hypothetical protein E7088_05365 [Bacteroidales bacterium]|nr:hypothetical protein [Bacteroidales bacterium]